MWAGRLQRLLEPRRAEQRRGPPQLVDVDHLAGDVDPLVGADLLADQRHREQRREVVGADRLLRLRAERGQRLDARLHDVGHQVEPRGRDLVGLQVESGAFVAHRGSPPRAAVWGREPTPRPDGSPPRPSRRSRGPGRPAARPAPGPRSARRSRRRTRCRGTGTRPSRPGRRTRPRRASSPGACTRRRTRTGRASTWATVTRPAGGVVGPHLALGDLPERPDPHEVHPACLLPSCRSGP